MTVRVLDNTAAPANIVDSGLATTVRIYCIVPPPCNSTLDVSFRLRSFAESIGPGQELQIGNTLTVPVVPGQTNYAADIALPGSTLLGEGELFGGVPVSGVYKIVAVLQHLNPVATEVSGFAEATIRMFRTP